MFSLLAFFIASAAYRETQGRYAAIQAYLAEQLSGISLVQMNAQEAASRALFGDLNQKYLDAFLRTIFAYAVFFPVVEFITNGTLAAPAGIDWICVSPKAQAQVVQRTGQELKLVYPQPGVDPAAFEGWAFERFLLQPMDGPDRVANTEAAIAYCLAHPKWRLSVQTHKYLGIP